MTGFAHVMKDIWFPSRYTNGPMGRQPFSLQLGNIYTWGNLALPHLQGTFCRKYSLQHTYMEGLEKATLYSTFEISHKHHSSYPNDFKSTLYKLFWNYELLFKRFASYDFDKRNLVTLSNHFKLTVVYSREC